MHTETDINTVIHAETDINSDRHADGHSVI